jgi:GAF domain-containing protein
VAKAALRFCGAADAIICLRDGESWTNVAHEGAMTANLGVRRPLNRENSIGRSIVDGRTCHLPDTDALDPREFPLARQLAAEHGFRAALAAPMLREGAAIGSIGLRKPEAGAFSSRQIALLESFAAQAVIAIENVRLFTELRESLEQQTATTEILQAINGSPGELHPVFDAIVEKAMTLCDATFGTFATFDGQTLHTAVTRGVPEAFTRFRLSNPPDYGPGTGPGRLIAGEDCVHDIDGADSEAYRRGDPNRRAIVDLGGARTILNVALRKDSALLGVISIYRQQVRPFSEKQIALLQAFAAQAVIAMENARLLGELRQRTDDLQESLEYQTATSEVLEVIGRSTSDIQPVLDTMLASACRLCGVEAGGVTVRRGDAMFYVATLGLTAAFDKFLRETAQPIDRGSAAGRAAFEKDVVHIPDLEADPEYALPQAATLGRLRSLLCVPLLREGEAVGTITLARTRVEPFTERQVALIRTFADQAVIAMENARLLGELTRREEELRVTFDHMGDGVVMFDANLKLASWNRNFQELLDVPDSFLAGRPGLEDYVRLLVQRGELGDGDADHEIARYSERASQQWSAERTRPDGKVIGVRNNPVPGGGAVLIYSDITRRKKAEAEIRAARDAAESALEQQTATADILKVIASSPTDVQPVLDAVARAARRFCGADDAMVVLREETEQLLATHEGSLQSLVGTRFPLDRSSATGRATIDGQTFHVPDVAALDPAEHAMTIELTRRTGIRALLAAPMLREGHAIGCVLLRRPTPGAFTPRQVELLEAFAAQAVIAIENVRLFTELRESLDQQTATAEILRAISQSPTDVQPVLAAVAKAAVRFCGAADALINLRDGDSWIPTAHVGPVSANIGLRFPLNRETANGRAIVDGLTCHLPDIAALDPVEFASARRFADEYGFAAVVSAPLLRDGVAIGSVGLRKAEPGPFTPPQISLLETFAAQAVIAIENVRLFTELRDSLERLKAAQANLVQSEKMATLGQLTAGIAHEIKNPLNFVNNFASLSVELLDELKEVAGPALETLDGERRAEVDETMSLLTSNLGKITEHGKRADGIVKSMLSHSRGGSGDWQASDINALVEEALNLAYHGARAQDKEFNVTLERDFEKTSKPIEVVPQDVTRVFLNLFGNGFYAANKRRLGAKNAGFRPLIKVSTRDLGEMVEVRVRDNGTGIPTEVREKLFQPFFTTKPTGEGTGLGLSISYDIVTQQHGGTIEVESEPGSFTEFTVRLPRSRRTATSGRA